MYKYLFIQLPIVIASGSLYLRASKTLLESKFNKRKHLLTVTFLLLWASWILSSAPYAIFELVLSNKDTDFKTINYKSFFEVLGRTNKMLSGRDEYLWLYTWENVTFFMKQCYGILNCVILVVLLKPLHERLTECLPACPSSKNSTP